ncbi:MAG TPA: insulinase family protein, partial [Myxococcota bacterium]
MSRALVVLALALASSSCVTTKQIHEVRSPDPRDDEPELTAAEKAQIAEKHGQALAKANPLRTVININGKEPIVNVRVVFEAGSADDPAGKEGLAALTAALMREATEKLSAAELADKLYPWAAELDVQVDKDTIAFIGRVHKDFANDFIAVLTDVIAHPRLAPADFERKRAEKKAFLENNLRSSNDELLQREELEASIYPAGHPYHHTPNGTVNGLAAITLDDVKDFIAQDLTRDRCVVGVSGGASLAVVADLDKSIEALPFSNGPRAVPAVPALSDRNTAILVDKPAAGSAISVGFALPELSRTSPDYAAMKLAETWFGEHRQLNGHLFHSMREERGLNYGDYAYIEHFVQDRGSTFERLNIPRRTQYFSMWIRPVEHKNRLFALRQTLWELEHFAADGIPDDAAFEGAKAFVQGYWRSKEQEPMRRLGYA